jgi:hypothetical protein
MEIFEGKLIRTCIVKWRLLQEGWRELMWIRSWAARPALQSVLSAPPTPSPPSGTGTTAPPLRYCIRTIVITQGPLLLGLLFLLEQSRLNRKFYSSTNKLFNYPGPHWIKLSLSLLSCYCQVMVGVVDPDPLGVVISTVSLFIGLESVLNPSLCSSWSDVYYLKFAYT